MRTAFLASFARDLRRVADRAARERIRAAIHQVEQAPDAGALPELRRLSRDEPYYRIRLGEHCAGVRVEDGTVTFVRVLPRAALYCYVP